MNPNRNPILSALASLRLTVTLLAMGMVLIFAGTTIQAEMGIWDVQRIYFHSWICLIEWRLFFPLWEWGSKNIPGAIPFPGGYTLIALLLVNLLAAHSMRFKMSWKRSGILLIHGGMVLLLVGEIITSEMAVESQMTIDVGGSANFTQDIREVELAVTDLSPADHDREIIIPVGRLLRKGTIQHPQLPFSIRVDAFFPNSEVVGPRQTVNEPVARPTAGVGLGMGVVERPKVTGTAGQTVDFPSALLSLTSNDGQELGSYLVSTMTLLPQFPQIHERQVVKVGDKEYWAQLRFKRYYKPYTIHLHKFSHDKYTGTDIPKNFSSFVQLVDPARNVDREVLIWMNHPLRYAGETFYQASFKPGDQTSILQVVKNPGWLLPYISCTLVGLGMIIHFGMHLLAFLGRLDRTTIPHAGPGAYSRRPGPVEQARPSWIPAAVISGLCIVYLFSVIRPPDRKPGGYDLGTFATLPVNYDGRTMPLDSLARNSLRIISGRSELRTDDGKLPAIQWLLNVFSRSEQAIDAKVFRIDHPDILSLMELDESKKLFSVLELNPHMAKLQAQFDMASRVESRKRDLYQRKIVELAQRILLFNRLTDATTLLLSPPIGHDDWRTLGQALEKIRTQRDPGAESFDQLKKAYQNASSGDFNAVAAGYRGVLEETMPQVVRKLDLEVLFNRAAPFYRCMVIYVVVFVLAALSWLRGSGALARASLWVLVVALVFHTLGLTARVYLQGRPPVTNLYSSAIFIAWGAVAFCVVMEMIFRNGVAAASGAVIAFPSLLIAHFLAGDGDTMKMLQAVLDTNIWLATHVVVITLGYSATFLAGILGIIYVIREIIGSRDVPTDRAVKPRGVMGAITAGLLIDSKTLSRMVYGVICFAMLFSFVGTILGGIWADQSWGRFWGWDPKENGAVLIVLWNAIILHARWGGLVREFGMAQLAIFGNAVTAWSWFGTNMLGVGLHSYGFMDSALFWLAAWVGLQLAIIAFGALWKLREMDAARVVQAPMTKPR